MQDTPITDASLACSWARGQGAQTFGFHGVNAGRFAYNFVTGESALSTGRIRVAWLVGVAFLAPLGGVLLLGMNDETRCSHKCISYGVGIFHQTTSG